MWDDIAMTHEPHRHLFEDFPVAFQHLHRPPQDIFCRGPWLTDKVFQKTRFVTIVGSREPSRYGIETCTKIIAGLHGCPITIVSGMARGIDSIAHQTALEYDLNTIAFPGSGVNDEVLYPRRGLSLAQKILQSGGSLISPFPPGQPSLPWMFPVRNHLMATLSEITLVIESAKKSGTLITAYAALEYGRTVAAVPGPINGSLSQGTNILIQNGAQLIQSSNDLLELLNLEQSESYQQDLALDLAADEQSILNKLSKESCSFDQLCHHTGKNPEDLLTILGTLEVQGLIEGVGGVFQKK